MSKNLIKNKIHKIRKSKSSQQKKKWPLDLQKKHSMNETNPTQKYNIRRIQDQTQFKKQLKENDQDLQRLQQKLRLEKSNNVKFYNRNMKDTIDKKNILNQLQKNNQENLFFKTKRHSYVFPVYQKKSKKITLPESLQNMIIPLENDEDYDTDDELLQKAISKVQNQLKDLVLIQK